MRLFSIRLIGIILGLVFGTTHFASAQDVQAPDSLGLPGDNLNLYAVMKIFRESETLEIFEKKLNDENNRINNLDLNGDNRVDYIRVIDKPSGSTHNIILQVPINEKESQDVAVFIVDKNDKGEVQIQLVGDESLYGKDYVIEPNYSKTEEGTPNPGYEKQSTKKYTDKEGNTTIINNYTSYQTAEWPCVRYMFAPSYIVWVSPWHWYYYPTYWNPWSPWYWHQYYGYHHRWYPYYYRDYRHCHYYRAPRARDNYYGGGRTVSVFVTVRGKEGRYRNTYERPETRKEGSNIFLNDKKIRKDMMQMDRENKGARGEGQPIRKQPKFQKDIKINKEEGEKLNQPIPRIKPNDRTKPQIQNNNRGLERFNERPVKTQPKIKQREIKIQNRKDRH